MPDSEQDEPQSKAESRVLPPEFEAAQWKPGQSGNPGGRAKRKPLTDAYAAVLDRTIPPDMARSLHLPESATYAEVIAMSLLREAVKGKVNAAAELADRTEGRVAQAVEHSGPDGGAIQIVSTIPRHSGTISE